MAIKQHSILAINSINFESLIALVTSARYEVLLLDRTPEFYDFYKFLLIIIIYISNNHITSVGVILQRIYLGFLSFFIAETLAGSSPMWIINPFSWLVAFPLYLLHFLFLTTIALRTGKTSLRHLYLWGMILGLYETWITKVIWSGYGDDGFAIGNIFGFGIHETIVLVLFWHPFFAFIIPLSIGTQLMEGVSDNPSQHNDFQDLRWLFSDLKFPKRFRRFSYITGLVTLGFNTGNPLVSIITSLPGILLVYLGYRRLFKNNIWDEESRYNVLQLKKRGLAIVSILLFALYVGGYFVIRADRIPGASQILTTILLYFSILFLIWKFSFKNMTDELGENIVVTNRDLMIKMIQIAIGAALITIVPFAFVFFIIIILLEIPFALYCAYTILIR